jgi:tetratricopeptide (TPR) repeat protein
MSSKAKAGRNERCPCGSGRKVKLCCGRDATISRAAAIPERPLATSAGQFLARAQHLINAGQHHGAIAPLLLAAKALPNDPGVANDLGVAYLRGRRFHEAVTWLRRAIAIEPTVALTHYNLGVALEQIGQHEAALAAQYQAIALRPNLAAAHGMAGELLARKRKHDEAARSYERAHAAEPDSDFGRRCEVLALVEREPRSGAEGRLSALIARDASNGEAHLVLGDLLNEAGRFVEAREQFERAITLAPGRGAAYYRLVSSMRLTESDRPVVARILWQLERKDLAESPRMALHFAAGKALDDLKDYAGAMGQFDAANQIRRRHAPLNRDALERLVGQLIARFTRELFTSHAPLGKDDETPVLVLGMPRSGTTLIERIVSSHPKAAGGGELSFWNEHGHACMDAPTDQLPKVADQYLRILRDIGPEAIRVTDKSPFNFLWIGLVHLLLPNARIVHCRRNPIDTCLSIYTTHFANTWAGTSDRGDLVSYYRQYLRLMRHWHAVLPPDRLLDVDYEDATAAPEPVAQRLIAFCGLDWDERCLQPDRNRDVIKTASTWQARQPIYRSSVERWRNYEPWLGALRELLPGP